MSDYQAIYDAVRSRLSNCDVGSAVESATRLEVGGVSFAIEGLRQEALTALAQHQRPSVLYRPQLMADGNMWCALYGEDLQVGVAGFGETPDEAMVAFDKAWLTERAQPTTPKEPRA